MPDVVRRCYLSLAEAAEGYGAAIRTIRRRVIERDVVAVHVRLRSNRAQVESLELGRLVGGGA